MFKTIFFRKPFSILCMLLLSKISLTADVQVNNNTQNTDQSNEPIFLDAFDQNTLANTATVALENQGKADVGKKYKISPQGIVLNDLNSLIEKHQKLVLLFEGQNSVSLQIMSQEKNFSMMQSQVILESTTITVVPIDKTNLISQEKLCLKITTHFQQDTFVEFLVADDFDISFNKSYKILANLSMNLNFRFKNIYSKVKENPENRIQFIVRTSLNKQELHGQEYISMKINKNKSGFPEEGESDLTASGNMGFGLIKTINNKNEFYCKEDSCEYRVTIKTLNIEYLYFFPTLVANGAEFNFQRNINVLEELEPNEIISYVLKVPQKQEDWVFRIIPSSFAPQYYLNPDKKVKNYLKSFYKVENETPTEILITNQEKEQFGFKDETFYLTFKNSSSTEACTFQFHMNTHDSSKMMRSIRQNYVHQGNLFKGEFLTFRLDLYQDEPHVNSIMIELNSYEGEVDLYLKECVDVYNCQFDQSEITNLQTQNNLSNITKVQSIQTEENKQLLTSSKLLLNVNCLGTGIVTKKELQISETFKKSQFCNFVVGLQEVASKKNGISYTLFTKGHEIAHPLSLRQSHNLTIQKDEKEYYYVKLDDNRSGKPLQFKINVISLVGHVNLYFSNFQKKPSDEDNELKITTKNSKKYFLKSASYEGVLQIPLQNTQNMIYIGIEGKKYSVFDLYIIPMEEIHMDEEIAVENIIKRSITVKDAFQTKDEIIYQKTFHFKPQEEYVNSSKFVIHNNSNVFGLELCVQLNQKKFHAEKQCDFKATNDSLIVPQGEWQEFAFSIRKIVKLNSLFQNFPIEINVHISSDFRLQIVSLHEQGKFHTSKIEPDSTIIYQINLTQMKYKFLILFQTESTSVHAEIYGSREKNSVIGQLNRISFGYEELRGNDFKNRYCQSKSCYIYVHVLNKGETPVDYSLIYTIDDMPIHLPLGKEIYIPNSIQTNYFTKVEKNESVSFHFYSDKVYFIAYGNIIEENKLTESKFQGQISEYRYEYKTNLDRQEEIVISHKSLDEFQSPVALFSLVPKDEFEVNQSQFQQGLQIYERENMVRVTAHQGEEKLEAFKEKDAILFRGEYNIYYFTLEKIENFTLFLSVHSGKALLVMNKGYGNIPTKKNYWKKIGSLHGGEVIISAKELKEDEKEFSVAVYAEEETKFTLQYMPEFYNIFPLKFQHLTEKKLKKGKTYYFDFYNQRNKFNSIFYAQYSDVEVSVLEYSKLFYQDFLTVIKEEENYLQKFVFKQGDVPRQKMSQVPLDIRYHYVIRMKPLTNDAEIFFLLFDKAKAIRVPSKKQFSFTIDKDDSQMFEIDFPSTYEEVEIDCKIQKGKIKVKISNSLDFQQEMELGGIEHKHMKYEIEHKNKDIMIFDKILILVEASELSSFKCRVIPKGQFKEIQPYEVELIKISQTEDKYVYFNMEERNTNRKVSIDIYLENAYFKPDLLYSGEQSVQIEDSENFLPMPLEDFNEKLEDKVRHLQITPSPVKGSFIIKFKPFQENIHAKISITLDDIKIIEPNGIHSKFLNQKNNDNTYSIYLPQAGEFRILPDTCAGMTIENTQFISNEENIDIQFQDNYAQAYPFLFYVESKNGEIVKEYKKLTMNIKRGLVNSSGVLKFNAVHQKTPNKNQYSYLLTEFRPQNKELVLKDYIDLWGDNEELNSLQYSVSLDKEKNSLKVEFLSPRFKKQLLQDYPDLKSVVLTYKFYMIKDGQFFENFVNCGFRAIEEFEHVQKKMQIHLSRDRIEAKRDNYWLHFEKEKLDHYFNEKFLNIYGEIEFIIIEKDEDYYNISLNRKFTVVPFFYMVIQNRFLQTFYWKELIFIVLSLIVLYYILKNRAQKVDQITIDDVQKYSKEKKNYQQVQREEFNNIEMN